MIVYCTPTGKREDLWETHVKRPKVFKCLGAYMSISLVLYLSQVKRLREEIVTLYECNLLVEGYHDTEIWLIIVIVVAQNIFVVNKDIKCTNTRKFGTLKVGKV